MRRKKREEIVECPVADPEIEVYVVETGIPVEVPAPYEPAVPLPVEPQPMEIPNEPNVTKSSRFPRK